MWKKLLCAFREHPHPKDRKSQAWPFSNYVVETCTGCGQQRNTFNGESAFR